jgi:pre-mRNA-splicing factor ATP-dependent RNA helicase DHX15/PRP43
MIQEIAPIYYDIDTFEKGEIKSALTRITEKIRRRQAMKGGR